MPLHPHISYTRLYTLNVHTLEEKKKRKLDL